MPLLTTLHDSPDNKERIAAYYRRMSRHCRHDRAALADLSRRYTRGLRLRWFWRTLWNALDRDHTIIPFQRRPSS